MNFCKDFLNQKNETLLQSLFENTYKIFFSGLIIFGVAQILTSEIDERLELANKRNALAIYKNSKLTKILNKLTNEFEDLNCTEEMNTEERNTCNSNISAYLTSLETIESNIKFLYPDHKFRKVGELHEIGTTIFNSDSISNDDLTKFNQAFGGAVGEIAQRFQ